MIKGKTTKINGMLEIDHERGVIYFHPDSSERYIGTVLRIQGLPMIPPIVPPGTQLDITVLDVMTSWTN